MIKPKMSLSQRFWKIFTVFACTVMAMFLCLNVEAQELSTQQTLPLAHPKAQPMELGTEKPLALSLALATEHPLAQPTELPQTQAQTQSPKHLQPHPRIVILAPAAADILSRLGAAGQVVGVTNSVSEFPSAQKVGTHLSPGIEKIASLRPGLIVANSRFNPALAERMDARLFIYEPRSLDGIIDNTRKLAAEIGRVDAGEKLAAELQAILDALASPAVKRTALYETRSRPLALGKHNSIIRDLLERAGLRYLYPANLGTVSVEYLLSSKPDIYIYQDGPMNRNPEPPGSRPGWERLETCFWKVNEFDFARPNTKLFETVRLLNEILLADDFCLRGQTAFGE